MILIEDTEAASAPTFSGVRPPPPFKVAVTLELVRFYKGEYSKVDDAIKTSKKTADTRIENQKMLGEAITYYKHADDLLGGADNKTLNGYTPVTTRDAVRNEIVQANGKLEALNIIGGNRDPRYPFIFGPALNTGALAIDEAKAREILDDKVHTQALEDGVWQSQSFQDSMLKAGENWPEFLRTLQYFAAKFPEYKSALDKWVAVPYQVPEQNRGVTTYTTYYYTFDVLNAPWNVANGSVFPTVTVYLQDATKALITGLGATYWLGIASMLKDKTKEVMESGNVQLINDFTTITNDVAGRVSTALSNEINATAHPVAYGCPPDFTGVDIRKSVGLLTNESNIASQKTQQSVQELQQNVSKQSTFASIVADVLRRIEQFLEKMLP